jgi:hypothetical protein
MPKYSKRSLRWGVTASFSLRAFSLTKRATRSLIRPWRAPAAIDCENEWISWLRTSLSTYVAKRRAARREYCGSSTISAAAVRMES